MPESARRIRFHPLFNDDVIDAANWYDARSRGLGDAFIANVRDVVDAIFAQPLRFARTPLGLRFARVKRFPYLVLFDVSDDRLLLLHVVHGARSTQAWRTDRE
jgi:hypothetical protein